MSPDWPAGCLVIKEDVLSRLAGGWRRRWWWGRGQRAREQYVFTRDARRRRLRGWCWPGAAKEYVLARLRDTVVGRRGQVVQGLTNSADGRQQPADAWMKFFGAHCDIVSIACAVVDPQAKIVRGTAHIAALWQAIKLAPQ